MAAKTAKKEVVAVDPKVELRSKIDELIDKYNESVEFGEFKVMNKLCEEIDEEREENQKLDEDELVRGLWEYYEAELASRNNADYVIDHGQMQKLIAAHIFFSNLAERSGGTVEVAKTEPKEEHGGLTARFPVFYISKKYIPAFCNIMQYASGLSIDSLTDGTVEISFTIPGIFRK